MHGSLLSISLGPAVSARHRPRYVRLDVWEKAAGDATQNCELAKTINYSIAPPTHDD